MAELEWKGIINFKSSNGKYWTTTTGLKYFDGYNAKRTVKNRNIDIILNIFESNTNSIPLFEARVISGNVDSKRFLSKTPTTIYRNVLSFLQISVKGKLNGFRFFGFFTNEYQNLLKNNINKEYDELNKELAEAELDDADIETSQQEQERPVAEKALPLTPSHQRVNSWGGVISYGVKSGNPNFIKTIGEKTFQYPLGYEVIRHVKSENRIIELHLKITVSDERPFFKAFTIEEPLFELGSFNLSKLVMDTFSKLNIASKRKWSGFEYFGLDRPDVLQLFVLNGNSSRMHNDKINSCQKEEKTENELRDSVMKDVTNIRKRNAGETGSLCKKASKARNEKIHKLVEYVSFGDIKSFINYMMTEFPEIVDDAIENNDLYCNHVIKNLSVKRLAVTLNCKETASILMGRSDLSQRSYKNIKKILHNSNVNLPAYDKVRSYIKAIKVGQIRKIHDTEDEECGCMGYKCEISETLQYIISTKELFESFKFLSQTQQERVSEFLKTEDKELYGNFNPARRTILLRETGDNFRASSRFPTEQISFAVMNSNLFLNSPYGQFVSNLWRGSEDRVTLEIHTKGHYEELEALVRGGVTLKVNETLEKFNILVFFVADLSFTKEILGRCTSTHTFGCFHCKLESKRWASLKKEKGIKHTLSSMVETGITAREQLGIPVDKNSTKYKKFTEENFAQWTSVLFRGATLSMIPPCGLHLILAIHRYLWKFLHNVISKRSQETLIPTALRKIGCTYLAYQIESYFKSKKKVYDGSETLKMIGNDCKQMEENIDSFLDVFVTEQGDTWNCEKSNKIRQVLKLYGLFNDLARDIRAIHPNEERIGTFGERVENFVQVFISNASGSSVNAMPYLHYLRNHIPQLMALHSRLFGMGYGYFSTNAGEHLNKCIKHYEISETNLDKSRFYTVTHLMRVKQFNFTSAILPSQKTLRCSACNQEGHNRKNKNCPLHPSHPRIEFDESDTES